MRILKILALVLFTLSYASCDNDDRHDDRYDDLDDHITTVIVTLTGGDGVITLKSFDLDGRGPQVPVVTTSGDLKVNTTYNGSVTFLNESVVPAYNINWEIIKDGDEHQLFFLAPSPIGVFTYADQDRYGRPIGLSFTLKTGANPAEGLLYVILRDDVNKNAPGVVIGDITYAGGETEAMVAFPIKVVD